MYLRRYTKPSQQLKLTTPPLSRVPNRAPPLRGPITVYGIYITYYIYRWPTCAAKRVGTRGGWSQLSTWPRRGCRAVWSGGRSRARGGDRRGCCCAAWRGLGCREHVGRCCPLGQASFSNVYCRKNGDLSAAARRYRAFSVCRDAT